MAFMKAPTKGLRIEPCIWSAVPLEGMWTRHVAFGKWKFYEGGSTQKGKPDDKNCAGSALVCICAQEALWSGTNERESETPEHCIRWEKTRMFLRETTSFLSFLFDM